MSQIAHIQSNNASLNARWRIMKAVRQFFWDQGFDEVETPLIVAYPGQEPFLNPMQIILHNEQGTPLAGYLHTSPEYTMKKMLAAGYEKIFSICKTFRDGESLGGSHNPEFTLMEWYRVGVDYNVIMDDVVQLLHALGLNRPVKRISMKELWHNQIKVDLDRHLTITAMRELCLKRGYAPQDEEPYEDLFYRIFLNEIEPTLQGAVIIYDYPAQMAALAQLGNDKRYAERFELYIDGNEIANAFTELTNAQEQRERFLEEQALRRSLGKAPISIDEEFLKAVEHMPPSAGIALGIDRLVMALIGCQNINDVLVLPASKQF